MKQGYTDINIVLDRSGSMSSVKRDTIGGFNQFLQEQQAVPGESTITLAQFDNIYEIIYDAAKLSEAEPLTDATFVPRGSTALLDAIGRTIYNTGERLSALPEDQRPDKVVFVILTDGEENSSREYSADRINEMISHQRDVYKWQFVFLGANQDAITTASKIGIHAHAALTYAANATGVAAAFGSASKRLASYRARAAEQMEFTDEDREKQSNAGAWQPPKTN